MTSAIARGMGPGAGEAVDKGQADDLWQIDESVVESGKLILASTAK